MSNLKGKKIILGVSGSIAAYKSAVLTRLLVKDGAEVKVVMTPGAKDFITPVTLSTLSKNPVYTEFISSPDTGEWTNHIDLGMWADVMLIAPASANTLGKMVSGICDNLLLAVYLSAKCPVIIAPAMDLDMFLHPSTTSNLSKLRAFGNRIIEPATGELASGLYGKGRMEEPEALVKYLHEFFDIKQRFAGKKALITAGPTHEALDPVRFIGNYSTGKMGFAIAHTLADEGAKVTLVTGPTHLELEHPLVNIIRVKSAEEMYNACIKIFQDQDLAVLSAAVADFRPKQVAANKLKKSTAINSLQMEPTVDVLYELGKQKRKKQLLVGFALETENELENAREKIARKNLDLIVLNSLKDEGAGFAYDTNKVTLADRQNNIEEFELKSKAAVAVDIVNKIAALMKL